MNASFLAIYRLVIRHQINRTRLIVFAIAGGVALLFGTLIGRDSPDDLDLIVTFVSEFGLSLAVPVLSLVLATAAIGQWVEDETLVYVWLRPISRFTLAAASMAATLSVTVPITVLMMTMSAALGSGFDGGTVIGAAIATGLAATAYTSIFVALGAVVRRALITGFLYVFIWEATVARFGEGLARMSVRSYSTSTLSRFSGVPLDLANRAEWSTYAVPFGILAIGTAITTWVLQNKDVP